MKEVDVSIIAANYNNSKYLHDFFASISNSTYYPREIIFVDDCSTDDSVSIVNSLNIKNLKLICLERNVGFSNALNIGVDNSSSKYILRVDPDDFNDPSRIKIQFEFLESNPQIDLVGSNSYFYNDRLKRVIGKTNLVNKHDDILKVLKTGQNAIGHGTIMCKSEVLKSNRFIQENYPAEEYDIFCRMILSGITCYNLNDCLLFYRIHGKSVSNKTPFSTFKKMNTLNKKYFRKRNNIFKVLRKYIFLKYYRLYLYEYGTIRGNLFLAISASMNIKAVIKRFLK